MGNCGNFGLGKAVGKFPFHGGGRAPSPPHHYTSYSKVIGVDGPG